MPISISPEINPDTRFLIGKTSLIPLNLTKKGNLKGILCQVFISHSTGLSADCVHLVTILVCVFVCAILQFRACKFLSKTCNTPPEIFYCVFGCPDQPQKNSA